MEFHPANRAFTSTAADFRVRFEISLANAFAAALAKEKKPEHVAGDDDFRALETEIQIA